MSTFLLHFRKLSYYNILMNEGAFLIITMQSLKYFFLKFGYKIIIPILTILMIIFFRYSMQHELENFFLGNNLFGSRSSALMRQVISKGCVHFDLNRKMVEELKTIQNDFIDDLINTHRDFIKDNKRYEVYHFLNHNCPSSTMRVLYSKDEKKYKEEKMEERSLPILGQLKTASSWNGRFIRRRDFHRVLSYGNYRLINLYRDSKCVCIDNYFENEKSYPNTLISKITNLKLLEEAKVGEPSSIKEGTYFLIYDKISKIYHTFRVYTMQNEGVHHKQKELNIFYDQETDYLNLPSEFRYLFEFFNLNVAV